MRAHLSGVLLAATVLGAVSCGERPETPDDVTEARIALTQVPATGVACIRVTVTGARTVVRSFDVTPGQSTVLTVGGLPAGNDTFLGEAFEPACNAVTTSTVATWLSDPTPATLTPGHVSDVALVLHRNAASRISIDFADDNRVLIVGSPSTASWNTDVQAKLVATGAFGQVDIFDATTGTPTLAQLQSYQAVLAFSDFPFADTNALGDVLADYFDGGGRVVDATFANVNTANLALGGRWHTGGYELIETLPQAGANETAPVQIVEAGSPLVAGVTTLTSTAGFKSSGGPINGAQVVARWGSSGAPLIVRGIKNGHAFAALNFYPPSADARGDFWIGDGAVIMRNALLFSGTVIGPRALVLGSPSTASWNGDVQTKLVGTGAFSQVDVFNATSATPTLAQLQSYQTVLAFSDFPFADTNALGDVLADYFDGGGRVVDATFANVNTANLALGGRWHTGGYELIETLSQTGANETAPVQIVEAGSPLVAGVTTLTSTAGFKSSGGPINGAQVVANWGSSGAPLIVRGVKNGRAFAGLNFYPPSADARGDFWIGDGAVIMKNAMLF